MSVTLPLSLQLPTHPTHAQVARDATQIPLQHPDVTCNEFHEEQTHEGCVLRC